MAANNLTFVFMFRYYLCLLSVFLCLFGCSKEQPITNNVISPKCLASQSQCTILTNLGELSVLFNVEKITTEQDFKITLAGRNLSPTHKVAAYIEGKDMYMGKIPVFFDFVNSNNSKMPNHFEAQAQLGSCAEKIMVWTLVLAVTYSDMQGEQTVGPYFIHFESTRN